MAVSPPHQPRMGLAAKRSSAAAKKSVAAYDEKQVKNLQFPEFVRARPSQLIGNIGKDGVFTIFREVLDNVVDEALAGRCNALYAHIDPKSKTFTVMDNGNGIPVGMIEVEDVLHNKHKVSALRAITGIMQTSGKYDDKAYATSRGCFAGDTEVQLLSGKTVTMEQLYNRWQKNKAPIPVMSFNLRTQKLEPSHISYAQLTKHTRDIVNVTLDSGDVIRVTPDHPFYVNTTSGRIRKVEAGKLRANDSLVSTYYSSDRDGYRVVRVEHLQLKKPIPVYDITVDNTHVFFINPGVLVSNTHGLGLKATNALSTKFVVTTFSKGQWWNIAYAKGKVVGSIKKGVAAPINPVTGNAMKKGTWVQFVPDASVLEADMLVPSDVQHWSTIAAYFTPGLGILLAVDTPKGMVTKKFYAPEGPVAYLRKRSTELSAIPLIEGTENDPFEKVMFTASNALLDCAVTFTSYSGSEFSAHTNGLQNREGGTHVDSFYKALRTSLTGFLKRGQELNLRSLKEGIVGIVNAKLSEPKFSSQDKVRLTDPRTAEPAVEFLTAELTAFLKKNRALATAIIEQAIAGDKLYSAYKLDKEASRNIKKIVRQGFPSKAKIAPNCKPEHRELYLVEGDSAGGCFSGDTLVNTTEGPMRLDAITAAYDSTGKVFSGWAFDCESKSIVGVRLTDPRETKKVQCLTRVEFDDGTFETCTHDHRWLMTAGYYTEARFLRSGDSVQAGDDGRPTDKTVVQTYDVDSDDAMPVYDVTVPGYENFQLASGPFVHNSAKLAHYHNFQEIFPLRGKIVNAERAAAKATANEEVQGIFALLGYNPSAPEGTDPLAKLRISKLIFMADPDIDGPLPGDTEVWVKMVDSDSPPAILMTMAQLAGPDFFDREYYVYTHNGQAMTWTPATNCMVRCVLTSWKNIVLDNGIEQPCSPTHQWLAIRTTQGGDTPVLTHALDLKPGDHICFRSEERSATRSLVATSSYTPRQPMRNVLIERIEDVQGPPTPFYCLTVPTFHTFMLGNEMMSGNCHINSLLLTLVAKYAPSLFARGMVYIAHVAEYYAYDEKTDTIYTGATANDVVNKLATASKRLVINHVKGYGEMDPAQLRKLAFDKSTRTLLRVVPEDASMKEFRMLMGNDAKVRREMIGVD